MRHFSHGQASYHACMHAAVTDCIQSYRETGVDYVWTNYTVALTPMHDLIQLYVELLQYQLVVRCITAALSLLLHLLCHSTSIFDFDVSSVVLVIEDQIVDVHFYLFPHDCSVFSL